MENDRRPATGEEIREPRSDGGTADRLSVAIHWFRRDLRLHDHPSLVAAAAADRLIPIYVFDPDDYGPSEYGGEGSFIYEKTGFHRARFRTEAVADLRASLRALDSELYVRVGDPAEVIPSFAERTGAEVVHAGSWDVPEERTTEARVRGALADRDDPTPLKTDPGHTLYHPADLPDGPAGIEDTYTPFRKSVENAADVDVRAPLGVPSLPPVTSPIGDDEDPLAPGRIPEPADLLDGGSADEETSEVDDMGDGNVDRRPDDMGDGNVDRRPDDALQYRGGEVAGISRLREYLWEGDHLRRYKKTRNGLVGRNYASKLSPWLNEGCLSPRAVHDEVRRYEAARVENDSTYWLIFELIWRDFFAFQVEKHGDRYFSQGGIRGRDDIEWAKGEEEKRLLCRWRRGQTGVPFVDAGIRELRATGYLSNRARQNIASFLANDCRVDWRKGAAFFETHLVDYDPCSNYGNWAYIAGVGNDSRDRAFDVVWQANRYDPDGEYVRRWVPEVADLPKEYVHEPWTMDPGMQGHYGVHLGEDYPWPVVEME